MTAEVENSSSLPCIVMGGLNMLPASIRAMWYHPINQQYQRHHQPSTLSGIIMPGGNQKDFPHVMLLTAEQLTRPAPPPSNITPFVFDVGLLQSQTLQTHTPDEQEFDTQIAKMLNTYVNPISQLNDFQLSLYIDRLFGLEVLRSNHNITYKDLIFGYERNYINICNTYLFFMMFEKVGTGTKTAKTLAYQSAFDNVMSSLWFMRERLINDYLLRKNVSRTGFDAPEDTHNIFRFAPLSLVDLQPVHTVILFLLKQAFKEGFRLYRGKCYQQRFYNSYPTHAWEPVYEVSDFLYRAVDKNIHGDIWQKLTATESVRRSVENYLQNQINDREFPRLEPNRHLFSFRDGIYNAANCSFYPYRDHPLPSDQVSCKYFDLMFDPQALSGIDDWYHIPTPQFQQILDTQELEEDVCRILYALMGRCLFNAREKDSWEVLLFIKGVAGSGKSTLAKVMMAFFHPDDVGILPSNIEEKFGLQELHDKKLVVCLEVKRKFYLNQGDLQSMISAELLSIACKNKSARKVLWTGSLFFCGNEVPETWLDASGSMVRRVVVVEFNKRVKFVDTTLDKKLQLEMGYLLHKIARAYQWLCEKVGTSKLWDKLPAYFQGTSKNLSSMINPCEEFLNTSPEFEFPPPTFLLADIPLEYAMPYEIFHQMFRDYLKKNGQHHINPNMDTYRTVFDSRGISVHEEASRTYGHERRKNQKWLYGIRTKQAEREFVPHH